MGSPFLHRFLGKSGKGPGNAERLEETICDWPVSLVGAHGPELLTFRILGIGEPAPRAAGIFIYARRTFQRQWQAIFIGETSDLRSRLAFNEVAADALLSGATDIHVLLAGKNKDWRRDTCERLIRINEPKLLDTSTTQTTQNDGRRPAAGRRGRAA
jgi:hypothetical protein